MNEIRYRYVKTPIGRLMLAGTERGLKRIEFETSKTTYGPQDGWIEDRSAFDDAARQLEEYFAGKRRSFDVALDPQGTEFQQRTWQALREIPYGATVTYSDVARTIGRPKAVRAVGAANGQNPLPVIVPCHRVIGSDGKLTGFAAGTDVKRTLLQLEGAVI